VTLVRGQLAGDGGATPNVSLSAPGPFIALTRSLWRRLAPAEALPVSEVELEHLRALADVLDRDEARDVYFPLCNLIQLRYASAGRQEAPYMIGLAGSVAVGKSTTARVLQMLLSRWPTERSVALVTTDGFLYSNDELARRGLMSRKGFPESYDVQRLARFLAAARHGDAALDVPMYSHLRYDVIPDRIQRIERPDVMIVEGLNVLQHHRADSGRPAHPAINEYFDVSIFLHAAEPLLQQWYVERFLALRGAVFHQPDSYFHNFAALSNRQARTVATRIWRETNLPNLRANIAPTMTNADIVLRKTDDHRVESVSVRV
jgi:type I pantothenate kinase